MIRIADSPIRLRCDIERADAILCFDASLLDARLLHRADKETLILVNSAGSKIQLSSPGDYRIFAIDAVAISQEYDLGRIVNSALLGAFCCLLGSPAADAMSDTILEAAPVKQKENVAACRAGFEAAMRQFVRNDSIKAAGAK